MLRNGAPSPPIDWLVNKTVESAHAFHHRDPGQADRHEIWWVQPSRPALILGSTQPEGLVHRAAAEADGVEVVRRRSGGGLVYVDPQTDCWIDAIIPRQSPLWTDDVGAAFYWLGELWKRVLGPADGSNPLPGTAELFPIEVFRPKKTGRPLRRPVWCFAELGHGEVTVAGRKVVGLSQRRTRHYIRLQSLVLGSWPAGDLAHYLVPSEVPDPADQPSEVVAGPPPGFHVPAPSELGQRFLESLNSD